MTPKEKAFDLVEMFYYKLPNNGLSEGTKKRRNEAKQCALIAVNNELGTIMWLDSLCNFNNDMKKYFESKILELKEVKQEIEKL